MMLSQEHEDINAPPQELLVAGEITMIRCDGIFVDSDVNQFGKNMSDN
jgi:hypothetical protein